MGQPVQEVKCPVYRKCGGCQLQNLSYERQLQWKQDRCQKLLGKFGKIAPILGMEDPAHYRNKVQAAFAFDKRHNKIISGVYQASTHRVVAVEKVAPTPKGYPRRWAKIQKAPL